MNLADVFTVVLVILGLLTVFVGLWLAAAALFPRVIDRCAHRIGTTPIKCALTGIVCLVPLFAVGIFVGKAIPNAPGKIASVVIILSSILTALFGTAGLALRIGQGLGSARDVQEPWRRVLRGGVVLAITFGTIVLIPLTLVSGFGAFVLAHAGRSAPVPPSDPVSV